MEQSAEKKPVDMLAHEYRQVLSLLREGLNNTITCNDIQRLTGLSSVKIRSIISELIVKYGYVIGASNKRGQQGFFIPKDSDEELAAILNLRSRRLAIVKREQALINNIASKYQEKLDLK